MHSETSAYVLFMSSKKVTSWKINPSMKDTAKDRLPPACILKFSVTASICFPSPKRCGVTSNRWTGNEPSHLDHQQYVGAPGGDRALCSRCRTSAAKPGL